MSVVAFQISLHRWVSRSQGSGVTKCYEALSNKPVIAGSSRHCAGCEPLSLRHRAVIKDPADDDFAHFIVYKKNSPTFLFASNN